MASKEGSFTRNAQDKYLRYELEKYNFKITAASARGNELIFTTELVYIYSQTLVYLIHLWVLHVAC